MKYFLIAFALLALAAPSSAHAAPWCKPKHKRGQDCWVPIDDLRPTQGALGMVDAEAKMEEIEELPKDGLKKYLKKNRVQIVIGPGDKFYLVDGHHHTRAVWESGYKEMRAEVIANYSDMSEKEFVARMKKEGKIRLQDKDGKALSGLSDLPKHIKNLGNDRYRSLAWLLRKSGAIRKTTVPFAEFYWADFLRKKVKIGRGDEGMKRAFKDALEVIARNDTSHLPGDVKRHNAKDPSKFHKECWKAFKALEVL